jgi:hypothetical protein
MTPAPVSGEAVKIEPYLAAYRNAQKIKGFFIFTDEHPLYPTHTIYPMQTEIYAQTNYDYTPPDSGGFISYINYWAARITDKQKLFGIKACSTPSAFGGAYGISLKGMRVLSGTYYSATATFHDSNGTSFGGSGNFIVFDDIWRDGVATRFNCSPSDAMNTIFPILCDAMGVPWATISADYSGISGDYFADGYVSADVYRLAVCAF